MSEEQTQLLGLIKQYNLESRHPVEVRRLMRKIERDQLTPFDVRRWLRKIKPWIEEQQKRFNPLPPPSQEDLGEFDIEIGELVENPGVRVGIRVVSGPRHLIVAGVTGSGKSNILRRIIDGLDALNRHASPFITILVLDFKGDFADVPDRLGRDLWDHYSTAEDFRLSCAPPHGCARHLASWVNQYTKIIAAHCDFKYAEATLAATLRIAFKLLNGDALAEPLTAPSLSLIAELFDTLPRAMIASKDEYLRTAQQKIRYLPRIAGGLFDAEEGFDIIKHLIVRRRCAVVDCTTASPLLGQILVNLLALQLMFSRIVQRQVSARTDFTFVIDEADQFCSRHASSIYPEGYSPFGTLYKQGRHFGIQVISGVSLLDQCSEFIRANTSYHVVMNQSDPAARAEAAKTVLQPNVQELIMTALYLLKNSVGIGR
jgi:hypothetical protein